MSDDPADRINNFARENAGEEAERLAEAMGAPAEADAPEQPEARPRRELPQIELPRPGRIYSDFARDLGRYAADEEIFIKDGNIVTVDERRGIIEPMAPDVFRTGIEGFCTPVRIKYKGPNEDPLILETSMSRDVAGSTLASPSFRDQLRPLIKVNPVPLPFKRKDGRIELARPGYDGEAQIFTLAPKGIKIRDLELAEARAILDDLLKEFPFAAQDADGNSRSKAVQIAAMLSMFAAGLFPPNTARLSSIWTANSQRTGKSLLAKIAISPVCGFPEVKGLPQNPEEVRKILDTAAISAAPYIFFDDIGTFLMNDHLNAFMTAPTWSNRLMNQQKEFKCNKVTTLFMTGNFLQMTPDLANRSLLCNLKIDTADFQGRKISRILDDQTLAAPEMRSDILSALWGLVRAWDRARRPLIEKGMAGFELYSRVIGGIVKNAGYGDPMVKPIDIEMGGDQRTKDMYALMEEIYNECHSGEPGFSKELKMREMADIAWRANLFGSVLSGHEYQDNNDVEHVELSPKSNSTFGKILSSFCGKRFELFNGAIMELSRTKKKRTRDYEVTFIKFSD